MAFLILFENSKQIFLGFFFLIIFQFIICKLLLLWVLSSLSPFPQQEKSVHEPPAMMDVFGNCPYIRHAFNPLWWWQISHLNPHSFLVIFFHSFVFSGLFYIIFRVFIRMHCSLLMSKNLIKAKVSPQLTCFQIFSVYSWTKSSKSILQWFFFSTSKG